MSTAIIVGTFIWMALIFADYKAYVAAKYPERTKYRNYPGGGFYALWKYGRHTR